MKIVKLLNEVNGTALELSAIVEGDSTHYGLFWNDGVTNEWSEFHGSYAIALLRYATLVECATKGKFFAYTGNRFTDFAVDFLDEQVVA
jgi:hypothetical protein